MTAARQPWVIATANRGKLAEFDLLCAGRDQPLRSLANFPKLELPDEGSSNYRENAFRKAQAVALHTQHWALGDDTGLEVATLAGQPGIHSARYAGPDASSAANCARLLEELQATGAVAHLAEFVCHLVLVNPQGEAVLESCGRCRGRIIREPRGNGGFGYDQHFELVEYRQTLGELGPMATSLISHRARAVDALWREFIANVR